MAIKYDTILGKLREEDSGFSGEFATTGFVMNSDSKRWQVTINDSGELVITDVTSAAGKPIGLLLTLTYSE